jgi:hypothetical protein
MRKRNNQISRPVSHIFAKFNHKSPKEKFRKVKIVGITFAN